MQLTAIAGIRSWSRWQPDRGMYFSSYLIERPGGSIAVDPLPLDDDDLRELEALGGVAAIVLTNRDHERDAAGMRSRFGSRVLASEVEAPLFGVSVDETFRDGQEVFAGIVALALPHGKTPGEAALHLPEHQTAIVGDAIVGAPAGALALPPDEKLADRDAFVLSLRRLWALRLDALLLCDGAPLFAGADDAVGRLLEASGGIAVNRINIDELTWIDDASPRGVYAASDAEIGDLIGARKLGYRLVIVPPGKSYCPLHAHEKCEEMFFVMEGEPTIHSLRGSVRLRSGDIIAFPTGDRGAHRLLNESNAPAKLLLLGMDRDDEVVSYPDSDKVSIIARAIRVRGGPQLPYYEGEE